MIKAISMGLFTMIFLFGCSQPLQITVESQENKTNTQSTQSKLNQNDTQPLKSNNESQSQEGLNNLKHLKQNTEQLFLFDQLVRLGMMEDEVIQYHGEPDQNDEYIRFYKRKHFSINLEEYGSVVGITTTDPKFLAVTQKEVEDIFGKPNPRLSDHAMGGRETTAYSINQGEAVLKFNWKITGKHADDGQTTIQLESIHLSFMDQ